MLAASVPLAKTLLVPARVVDVVAQADRMRGVRNAAVAVPHRVAVAPAVVVVLVVRVLLVVARALPGHHRVAARSSAVAARAALVVLSDLPVADSQLVEARPRVVCDRALTYLRHRKRLFDRTRS